MSRLTKKEAQIVRDGLMNRLTHKFQHPDYLPNEFGGIWINDAQKRAYLRRMAEAGHIEMTQHWRGWYSWCTYRLLELPF